MSRPREDLGTRFWKKVEIKENKECWNWLAKGNRQGYGEFWDNDTQSSVPSHRVAWIITNRKIPDGMLVCHRCDNTSCVNPNHLFLGTQSDNINDMYRKGRGVNNKGENSGVSKLTESDVLKIVDYRVNHKMKLREISNNFQISISHVNNILIGKSWSWLTKR